MIPLRLLAAALGLALTPLAFVHPVRISGRSMEPLLRNGDLHWALRAWCAGPPRPGDVWLAAAPSGTVVKRLVAGPNRRVEIRDGDVWIDGRIDPEPYAVSTDPATGGTWDTGPGWFLLGDNRPQSRDSRAWGPLPASALEARVMGKR